MIHAGRAGRLGLFGVAALGINGIVGSAIFRLPAELARDLGAASYTAFGLGALVLVPVALCFAEAGGMFSRTGGPYVYASEAFGRPVGFAVGWSIWAGAPLTLAAVAVAVPGQLAELVPGLAGPGVEKGLAVGIIAALGGLNLLGVRPASWLTSFLALAKVLPLVLFVAVGAFFVEAETYARAAPPEWGKLGPSLLAAFFALSGFETAAIPAGDAARPRRDVPIAVVGSVLGAGVLYVLIQVVVVGLAPAAAASERPIADAARAFAGEPGARAVAVVAALSMLGLCAAMAFAGPRSLLALAEDGWLPGALARSRPHSGAPALAVAVNTAVAAGLAVLLDFRRLVDFTSVVVLLGYLATCAAVPILRVRRPELPRTVRLPLGPVIPLAGAGLLVWVLTQAGGLELGLTAAVLAGGALVAIVYRWRRR